MYEKLNKSMNEIIDKIEELIKEGNLRRIIVKDQKGNVFIEIPIAIAAVVAIAAPIATFVGVLTGYAINFTVELLKKDSPQKIIYLLENNPRKRN